MVKYKSYYTQIFIMNDIKYKTHTDILKDFLEIFDKNGIVWCVGSSTSLFLQGVDIFPKDIDLIIDSIQIENTFKLLVENGYELLKKSEDFNGNSIIKGSINKYEIPVEIVGFELFKDDLIKLDINDQKIPVYPLEIELEFYKQRKGKEKVVELINQKLTK